MHSIITHLLDLFFPRRSLSGGEGEFVTAEELEMLQSSPVILREERLRSEGLEFLDRIVAAADYDEVPLLHRAVHTLKYKRVHGVGETLGAILADVAGRNCSSMDGATPVLCPVPLHWTRKFNRGFNQAEVLAEVVGRAWGWDVKNLLRRTRSTGSQVGRKRADRLVGVHDAFRMKFLNEVPRYVILVDDLSTTGSTLDMCAKALKKAGVERVEGLVLAMG